MQQKYKTIIGSSPLKCVTSEDKDRLLALASLDQLKSFIPVIDTKINYDLLPIVFNACVVGRVNKNDDVINKETALEIYKNFINKYIDVEHKKSTIVGVILTAGFSEFGTDKPMSEEEIRNTNNPFNITLGGVIWKYANEEVSDFIEESNDPTSEYYMKASTSWELSFEKNSIIELPKDQKNINGGKVISNAEQVEALSKHLRINGGSGEVNGNRLYRMPTGNVNPIGIGITEKPAADVKGILVKIEDITNSDAALNGTPTYDFYFCPSCMKEVPNDKKSIVINPYGHIECPNCHSTTPTAQWTNKPSKSNPKLEDDKSNSAQSIDKKNKILDINEKNISQSQNQHVKIERKQIMFNSIKDITDDKIKEAVASQQAIAGTIAELFSNEIKKGSEQWTTEKKQLVAEREEVQSKLAAAEEKANQTKAEVEALKDSIQQLEKDKADREAVAAFNTRMSKVLEAYEFDEEQTALIASELREIKAEEEFTKWESKAAKLFKPFKKKNKDGDKKDDKDDESSAAKKDSKKDDTDKSDDTDDKDEDSSDASVVDKALDNAKKVGLVANTSVASESLADKYRTAFAFDNFIVTKR